jgi:hypothetical protein
MSKKDRLNNNVIARRDKFAYFDLEYVGEDVFHFDPVENGHRRVGPHPIHHSSQFEQERNRHETFEQEHVDVVVALAEEVS